MLGALPLNARVKWSWLRALMLSEIDVLVSADQAHLRIVLDQYWKTVPKALQSDI